MTKSLSIPSNKPLDTWAFVAPLVTVLIWSGNTIVTKLAAGAISPGSIAFYRWLGALVVLAPFVGATAWRNRRAAAAVWKQILFGSLLGMVIYQCLAYIAAETTTAINMGVIGAMMPLFSVFLASLLASERMTLPSLLGGAVSIAGVVYLTSRGHPISLIKEGMHLGDALMLIAVLANALYGVLLRRWAFTLPVWEQMFWQIAAATLVLIPVWLLGPISSITEKNLPLVLYAAIPASLIAPAGWIVGIARLGAARTALMSNLIPAIVAAMAWLIVGEDLRPYHLIGGGVALLGVIIGLREWKFIPCGRP